jgi:hypothetical protein
VIIHIEPGWLLLCLCVLAHSCAGRLPPTRYLTLVSAVVWAFAVAVVMVLLMRGLRGA